MLVHLKQQQQRKIKDKANHSNCEYWHQRQQTKYPLLSGLFQWSGPVEGAGKVWWLENCDLHGHVLHRSKRNYNDRRTTWIELNWIPAATWSVYKAAARYIWLPSCALFFWLNKTDMGVDGEISLQSGKERFIRPICSTTREILGHSFIKCRTIEEEEEREAGQVNMTTGHNRQQHVHEMVIIFA